MEFIKPGRQFDFMSKRRLFIGASLVLLLLSARRLALAESLTVTQIYKTSGRLPKSGQ